MAATRLFKLNRNLINPDLYKRIHALWFAHQPIDSAVPTPDSMKRWFQNPDKEAAKAFDNECATVCFPALDSLSPKATGLPAFTDWTTEHSQSSTLSAPLWDEITEINQDTDQGRNAASSRALALVLLLDQMPRNIHRQSQGVIYSHYDRLAQAIARRILSTEPRLDLAPWIVAKPFMRNWFYLPLMHSEDLDGDHALLSRLAASMRQEQLELGNDEGIKYSNHLADFEDRHAEILREFGRYPYRNKALGRVSTAAEDDYEKNGGERFSA